MSYPWGFWHGDFPVDIHGDQAGKMWIDVVAAFNVKAWCILQGLDVKMRRKNNTTVAVLTSEASDILSEEGRYLGRQTPVL